MRYAKCLLLIFVPVLTLADTGHETRHFELSTKGVEILVIDCQAGSLDVRGVAGGNQIDVIAEIILDNISESHRRKFFEENILLSLERLRNKAILQSKIRGPSLTGDQTRIDLTLEVPRKINLKVVDGSGPISIRNILGNLEIDDDTGSIKIANIVGKVNVNDSSGSIDIAEIKGRVEVKDGSGSIEINLVEGDVSVTDGSGEMTIQDVAGKVTVSDGSGSIEINDVAKNVFILEAGSGALSVEGVKGKVTIRD
jgi:DUF4097 and DUF4098 domain-containing protein YvlB